VPLAGIIVAAGLSASAGMGEAGPASEMLSLQATTPHVELRAEYDGSGKLEANGRGYILRAASEVSIRHLVASASVARRDGGDWAKAPVRVGFGARRGIARLLYEADLTTQERVDSVELRLRHSGALSLETRLTAYHYIQDGGHYGFGAVVLVGREF
jgi:hypothetical protein